MKENEKNMSKYVKVMFGTKSGADSDFEYKIGEVNEANNWNPMLDDPKDFGGFNFSVESKVLRWLIRGDTIYDVTIPEDAEVVNVPHPTTPNGVFRTNKIILTNPRIVTDELAMHLYKISDLPEKTYFQSIAVCCIRGFMNTALKIFNDKVNKDNIDFAFESFTDWLIPKGENEFREELLQENTRKIYDLFLKQKNCN